MLGRIGVRRLGASILALLLSLTSVNAHAQAGATVTGTVKSDAGQPLFGANVTIEALAVSVGTSEDGRYTINVPGASVRGQQVVLRARAIGYVPVVRTITLNAGSQTQDFELKQDGVPQKITNFFAVAGAKVLLEDGKTVPLDSQEAAAEVPRDLKSRYVFYIDNQNIQPMNRNRMFRRLKEFIPQVIGPSAEGMVISYSRSLKVRQKLTSDLEGDPERHWPSCQNSGG